MPLIDFLETAVNGDTIKNVAGHQSKSTGTAGEINKEG